MTKICSICDKVEIFSTDEEKDFCIMCWTKGRVFERILSSDERANILPRLRELEKVCLAEVWHVENGMFNLSVMLQDGRWLRPGLSAEMFGQQIVLPAIPTVDQEWGVMVARPVEEDNEWSSPATVLPDRVDDEGLITLIQEIA